MEKLLKDKKAMNEKKVAIEVAIPMLTILKQLHAMKIIHRCVEVAACLSRTHYIVMYYHRLQLPSPNETSASGTATEPCLMHTKTASNLFCSFLPQRYQARKYIHR